MQTPSPGPKMELATSTTPATTSAATNATCSSSLSNSNKRGRKPDHDDISQEQVLRIYHEELAKMMSGASSGFNPAFSAAGLTPASLSALSSSRSMASNLRDYNR